jgi:DNA-binding protein HU-beta
MTRTQLVSTLARRSGVHADDVKRVIDELFDRLIPTEVASGRSVAVRGFGTFEGKVRKARLVRHPESGELLHVASRRVLSLRPARPSATTKPAP